MSISPVVTDSLKRNIERLPRGLALYDRDPANKESNIRNLLAAFSKEDDTLWEILRQIKRSRFFEEAKLFFDEDGVDSWVVDLLVAVVGTVRKKGWSDDRLLREMDWDVFEHWSWGNFDQIKALLEHYFEERYPQSRVLTPEVEQVISDEDGTGTFTVVPTDHTGDRVVTGEDIYIFENERPFRATPESPLEFPYLSPDNGKAHSRYGIFSNIHFISLPHEAIPKKLNNAFIPRVAPDDGMGGKLFNSVTNLRNGVNRGLIGVSEESVDLDELNAFANRVSQAHVHTVLWAHGGFIPREAPPDGMGGKLFNSVTNPWHGVGGLVDGDVSRLVTV